MSEMTLFHAPGACSRVTMNALEEIGLPYSDRVVNIFAGEQKSPGYLAINPKGKVPALQMDDHVLTENASILYYLHTLHPQAELLPERLAPNAGLEDLVWCSSTVHPMVRQVRMPSRFTDADAEGVRAHGMKHFAAIASVIESRIDRDRWWYGERWSIVDVYVYWNYSTAASGGFSLKDRPALLDHARRVRARESFRRALDRERHAQQTAGITLPPGASL